MNRKQSKLNNYMNIKMRQFHHPTATNQNIEFSYEHILVLIKKLYNLNMGCNSFKQNVIVEVVYCGGVGWSLPAKRVCEAIKLKLPKCTIDCRPEQVFTGVLEINLLLDRKQKKFVYKEYGTNKLASLKSIQGDMINKGSFLVNKSSIIGSIFFFILDQVLAQFDQIMIVFIILVKNMRTMFILALAVLVVNVGATMSEVPFQQVFINSTHLQCLQGKGLLDQIFVQGELESTQTFKFFITSVDFSELQAYSFMPHFNITLTDLQFFVPPEISAAFYSSTLQKYYYKMLWFNVADTRPDISCNQLWTFISRIRINTQKPIGIIGNKKDWIAKFGSTTTCTQFSVFPLFYSGIGEFQSFAGWGEYQFSLKSNTIWDNECSVYYKEIGFLRANSLRIDQ